MLTNIQSRWIIYYLNYIDLFYLQRVYYFFDGLTMCSNDGRAYKIAPQILAS